MTSPPTADELPAWARKTIMGGSAGYAATSITASSFALGHLAWEAGYHDPRAILFGLAFEVAAMVTGTAWAAGTRGSWWEITGRRATIGLFGASLLFNAAEVLQVRNGDDGKPLLPAAGLLVIAVLVSFVFPVLSLLFGHLFLVAKRAVTALTTAAAPQQNAEPAAPAPTQPAAPADETSPVTPPPTPADEQFLSLPRNVAPAVVLKPAAGADAPTRQRSVDELVDDVATFIAQRRKAGEHFGQRTIADKFGLSRKDAAEVQKKALERLSTPPARTNGVRVPLPTAGA